VLLEAMRSLRWSQASGTLAPVDYRNMGAEELGSVYESLLQLLPDPHARTSGFIKADEAGDTKGNARKTTGSYYTPDSLVQELIRSALDPVIEPRLAARRWRCYRWPRRDSLTCGATASSPGRCPLYLLTVADSRERKSSCDTIFSSALRDWESGRLLAVAPNLPARGAALAAFEAKKPSVFDAIRHKRRRSQDTAKEEHELDALARDAPPSVAVPRLLYADATPEALAHAPATGWPSGGVLSAEAGTVFGVHGLGARGP
jgi:hypothetical protein